MAQDSPTTDAAGQSAELSTAECWRLLESQHIGRLAVVDLSGDPDVLPVNHTTHEGRIYLRSARGAKLQHLRAHPAVAFEVDGVEGDDHWSVVVRGHAEEVALDDEIRRSGVLALSTVTTTVKPFVIRIDPASVTGRRFRPGPSQEAASAPGAPEGTEPRGDRAESPRPVPHRPPLT